MAITKSAKKALRQSDRRKVFNQKRARAMKDAAKAVAKGGTDKAALSAAYRAIDKAAKRGLIHKNTAARKKSSAAALFGITA